MEAVLRSYLAVNEICRSPKSQLRGVFLRNTTVLGLLCWSVDAHALDVTVCEASVANTLSLVGAGFLSFFCTLGPL